MSASSATLSLEFIRALDEGKQSRIAAIALLVYDHFLVFDMEVQYVWSQKWTFGKYLYFFNGWLALLWLIFDAWVPFFPGPAPPSGCVTYLIVDDIVTVVTTLTVQIILQLRIYAIYQRNRKLLVALLVICTVEITVMAVLMGKTMVELRRLPVIATNTGCAYTGLLPTSSLFWTPALIFEPILCLCVVVKTWKDLPRGIIWGPAKTLPAVLARDSFMYFITVFASLLAATIIWAHYPHYINLINPWASAIPSLLGSRLLLNMRATMLETEVLTTKGIGMPMDDDTITLPPLVAANAQA